MDKSSTGKIIVKTALVAAAAIVLAAVIIAVVIFLCFPFEGYKFADNMGMDRLALRFAENYADDGNIDGLVYCIDKADKLLEKSGNTSYATKLVSYTEDFFSYDNAEEYFAQLDDYYNDEAFDVRVRVGLYSYMGHVIEVNYKARTLLGKDDMMLFRGSPTALSDVFAAEDVTIMERAYVISALTKQLLLGKSALVDVDEDGAMTATECYWSALDMASRQMASLSDCKADEMKYFYVLHGLYYFINGMEDYLASSEINKDKLDTLLNYQVDGMSLEEAYRQQLGRLNNKGGANEK